MKTIIVGIDGSHAAITAALWGVDEAISRAVPLRLVSVIKPTHPSPDTTTTATLRMLKDRFGKRSPLLRPRASSSRSKPTSPAGQPARCLWRHRATPR